MLNPLHAITFWKASRNHFRNASHTAFAAETFRRHSVGGAMSVQHPNPRHHEARNKRSCYPHAHIPTPHTPLQKSALPTFFSFSRVQLANSFHSRRNRSPMHCFRLPCNTFPRSGRNSGKRNAAAGILAANTRVTGTPASYTILLHPPIRTFHMDLSTFSQSNPQSGTSHAQSLQNNAWVSGSASTLD